MDTPVPRSDDLGDETPREPMWPQQVDRIVDALNRDNGPEWVTAQEVGQMLEALSRAGLAIIPAADLPSAEERKVLEAVSMVPTECLLDSEADPEITPDWYLKMVRAELSRRAAREGK